MVGQRSRALLVGLFAALVTFWLCSCGSDVSGSAQPAGGSLVDVTQATSGAATTTKRPTQKPTATEKQGTDTGGDIDFEVEIGQCVQLGGTDTNAQIDLATCGSNDSNYKVIGKAPTNSQCISDADAYYAETLNGIETGALCLDIDWAVGTCMELSGDDPLRIDCTEPAIDGVKVTEIQQNADSVDGCSSGSGFVYDQRRFTVCTEEI